MADWTYLAEPALFCPYCDCADEDYDHDLVNNVPQAVVCQGCGRTFLAEMVVNEVVYNSRPLEESP